jgi:hypothetical protein
MYIVLHTNVLSLSKKKKTANVVKSTDGESYYLGRFPLTDAHKVGSGERGGTSIHHLNGLGAAAVERVCAGVREGGCLG